MVKVTEDNINLYTFEDVIFPILGHKVEMPSNPFMKKIVEDIMAEDDITMEKFSSHA